MPGRHLTLEHREVLAQMTCRGQHPDQIAAALGCHRSTVYRERRRNGQEGDYFPARAQAAADASRRARAARARAPYGPEVSR
jgi:IS30 family transposase